MLLVQYFSHEKFPPPPTHVYCAAHSVGAVQVWPSTPVGVAYRHAFDEPLPRSHAGCPGSVQPHCGKIEQGCTAQPFDASIGLLSIAASALLPLPSPFPLPVLPSVCVALPFAHAHRTAIASKASRMCELLPASGERASCPY